MAILHNYTQANWINRKVDNNQILEILNHDMATKYSTDGDKFGVTENFGVPYNFDIDNAITGWNAFFSMTNCILESGAINQRPGARTTEFNMHDDVFFFSFNAIIKSMFDGWRGYHQTEVTPLRDGPHPYGLTSDMTWWIDPVSNKMESRKYLHWKQGGQWFNKIFTSGVLPGGRYWKPSDGILKLWSGFDSAETQMIENHGCADLYSDFRQSDPLSDPKFDQYEGPHISGPGFEVPSCPVLDWSPSYQVQTEPSYCKGRQCNIDCAKAFAWIWIFYKFISFDSSERVYMKDGYYVDMPHLPVDRPSSFHAGLQVTL